MPNTDDVAEALAAIGLLTERRAEVYARREIGDHKRGSVAADLGIAPSTVDGHLRDARRVIEQARETLETLEEYDV